MLTAKEHQTSFLFTPHTHWCCQHQSFCVTVHPAALAHVLGAPQRPLPVTWLLPETTSIRPVLPVQKS